MSWRLSFHISPGVTWVFFTDRRGSSNMKLYTWAKYWMFVQGFFWILPINNLGTWCNLMSICAKCVATNHHNGFALQFWHHSAPIGITNNQLFWLICHSPKCVFPKIVGFPPKSSILIGFSIIFTIHFGVFPYFWKHPNLLENRPIFLLPGKFTRHKSSVSIQQKPWFKRLFINRWFRGKLRPISGDDPNAIQNDGA